ncbi:disease resistance protein RPM1-like [Macadamia integrifolia]|uniref:disease resistance protein RPM1-like n=1 Tax=Macadamia integrifolia TaxID=60698 RepID=UPI001C4ECC7F|nr:disease resistance protein RPM1-like [Macadamia integrifolia]
MAEGIFQERAGEVREDIVEENINQLVAQGILRIEIGFRNELKVVEPYLKICRLKLQQGELIDWFLGSDSNLPESSRIVLVQYHGETIRTSLNDDPIRSLFVYCTRYSQGLVPYEYWEEGIPNDHWASIRSAFHTFNFLRVLEFHNLKVKSLPEEIGDMINLRYLGLKNSALDEIPESIGNLINLQTLDIRWPRCPRVLPSGVLNLAQLRHLMLPRNGIKVPSGIGILTNLQSLINLFIRPGIIQELRSLTQLKKLKLIDVSEEHGSELCACIMKMTGLVSLSLETRGFENDELLPTLESYSPPPSFRKLRLYGRLMDLPNWVCSMENLTKLILGYSFLSEEAISVLRFLPNLKHLTPWEACKVKVMNKEFCRVGGLPKLEALVIANQNLLEWTEIEEGALPSLAFLHFHCCSQLRILPEGLQYVTTLKVLNMFPLHPDLKRRLSRDGGKENYKIKHIPLLGSFGSFG